MFNFIPIFYIKSLLNSVRCKFSRKYKSTPPLQLKLYHDEKFCISDHTGFFAKILFLLTLSMVEDILLFRSAVYCF